MKYWKFNEPTLADVSEISNRLNVPTLVGGVMASRGISVEEAYSFLNSNKLHNPYLMKGMNEAVALIRDAIENDKMVAVFGDYDCDGVTSTAILNDYLNNIGCNSIFYIPHREEEGYGINIKAVEELHKMGVELIITVDNGISAIDEIARAKELGITVVVTDHHMPREILPSADAIINPHQEGCDYPFKELSGVGVAFKLICALEDDVDCYETLHEYCDLVAIGTVADIVELKDENRIFVREGVVSLRDPHRIGLRRLMDIAAIDTNSLTSETIAFSIAPRINSVGRLDSAEMAVLLLLTEDIREADDIISQMQQHNADRKSIEREIFLSVQKKVNEHPEILNDRVLVFYGEDWNAGVIGIVASRVVNAYGKPTIIISKGENEAKASGRSVEGFSLIDAIFASSNLLTKYGGHPMAAGLSLLNENIDKFIFRINSYAKEHYFKMPVDSISVDYICSPSEININSIKNIARLEPFGAGNEKPLFCLQNVAITKIQSLSEGKHQKITVQKEDESFEILFFSRSRESIPFTIGDIIDITFTLSINTYNGAEKISLKGVDMHISNLNQENYFEGVALFDNYKRNELCGAGFVPSRDEFAEVYKYIRSKRRLEANSQKIHLGCSNGEMPYINFLIALEAMIELKLISKVEGHIIINPVTEKVSLESSKVIRSLMENETKS